MCMINFKTFCKHLPQQILFLSHHLTFPRVVCLLGSPLEEKTTSTSCAAGVRKSPVTHMNRLCLPLQPMFIQRTYIHRIVCKLLVHQFRFYQTYPEKKKQRTRGNKFRFS